MTKLNASFRKDDDFNLGTLVIIIATYNRRNHPLEIRFGHDGHYVLKASGSPRDIMVLIGLVSNAGYDVLSKVI